MLYDATGRAGSRLLAVHEALARGQCGGECRSDLPEMPFGEHCDGGDPDGHSRTVLERRLTLAEAQQIECNGCGDCCDSRRVARTEDGQFAWRWGRILGGEQWLIIPLESSEQGRIDGFRCTAFLGNAESGVCTAYDRRPARCRSFPVFGAHAEDISAAVERDGEYRLPLTDTLFRCAWAGVTIVA